MEQATLYINTGEMPPLVCLNFMQSGEHALKCPLWKPGRVGTVLMIHRSGPLPPSPLLVSWSQSTSLGSSASFSFPITL